MSRGILFIFASFIFLLVSCAPAITQVTPLTTLQQSQESLSNWSTYEVERISLALPAIWQHVSKESEIAEFFYPELSGFDDPMYDELFAGFDKSPETFPDTDIFIDKESIVIELPLSSYTAFAVLHLERMGNMIRDIENRFIDLPIGQAAVVSYISDIEGEDYDLYIQQYFFALTDEADEFYILTLRTAPQYAEAYSPIFDKIAKTLQKHTQTVTAGL